MAPQLAHLMRVGAVRVETAARRMSRRDLDTFFLGTGCLAISGHFLETPRGVCTNKPLSNLQAEGQKVNPKALLGRLDRYAARGVKEGHDPA